MPGNETDETKEIEKFIGTLKNTPPPNPFVGLLHSRKFWLAVLALANTIVSTYFHVDNGVIASANIVLMVVVGAIAYEDVNG